MCGGASSKGITVRLHRRLPLLTLPLILAVALAACSGGDDDNDGDATPAAGETPAATRTAASGGSDASDLREHEDELRETVPDAIKAMLAGGGVDAYSYASADFKEKCALDDFIGVIAFVKVFLGDIDENNVEVTVTDIRYGDDRAFVTAKVMIAGEDFDEDAGDDEGEFGDFWVYEGGEWKWGTDDEEPCNTDFSSGDDADATPATGPGSSRAEPVAFGDSATSGDLRVSVIEADLDAADRLPDVSDFPETPEAGLRVVLVRVRAEHTGSDADETIQVSESDFKLTGSGNVLYDSFEHGCNFIDDGIDGEMFPGGSTEGWACFEIPAEERDLLLVLDPNFGFDQGERRYLALE